MRIRMKTGKTSTTPNGTETVELPRNRSGLLSKAKREATALFLDDSLLSSSDMGSSKDFVEGAILDARLRRSMFVMYACLEAGRRYWDQRVGRRKA